MFFISYLYWTKEMLLKFISIVDVYNMNSLVIICLHTYWLCSMYKLTVNRCQYFHLLNQMKRKYRLYVSNLQMSASHF